MTSTGGKRKMTSTRDKMASTDGKSIEDKAIDERNDHHILITSLLTTPAR
jgi:hypothetical protein